MKLDPRWPAACLGMVLWGAAATATAQTVEEEHSLLLENRVLSVTEGRVSGNVPLPEGTVSTKFVQLTMGWLVAGSKQTETGVDLFIAEWTGNELRELAAPAPKQVPMRAEATPIAEDGSLAGLLWMEGDRRNRLAVHSAARDGESWTPIEVVSAPGPGSQVALSAGVLPDGSWLAVWTWVDATGDAETVWSIRRAGSWSAPARVHEDNDVHDVQPALAIYKGAAVVVWTGFDGSDYRMRRASFNGQAWTTTGFFGGRGASDPVFTTDAERVTLLYMTVAPSTWSVLEFGPAGEPVGAGHLEREPHDFGPLLLTRSVEGATDLVWPEGGPELPERRRQLTVEPLGPPSDPED